MSSQDAPFLPSLLSPAVICCRASQKLHSACNVLYDRPGLRFAALSKKIGSPV